MAPLSPLQKKVYMSILRKELPKLLALASRGTSSQSLQNIVSLSIFYFILFECELFYCRSIMACL